MKSFEEFKEFFKESVIGDLEELEERRKGMYIQRVRLMAIAGGLILFHSILILFKAFIPLSIIGTVIVVPIITFLVYRKLYVDEEIPDDYKDAVVKRMVEFLDPSLDYEADKHIPYEDFEESQLFLIKPDHYNGDDLISGEIDEVPFQMSELLVQYELKDRKHKKPKWNTTFNGIFLIAEAPIEFKGSTFILPDKLQGSLGYVGRLVQQNNLRNGKYIHPTNPDFAQRFVVYSDTILEGERILTEGFMEKLLYLRKKSASDVYVSLIGNKIFIGVDLQREIFKVNLAFPLYNANFIREFYDEIYYIFNIVEDLKINELLLPNEEVETEEE